MSLFRKIENYIQLHFKFVAGFFIVFYAVGIAGLILPDTFIFFKKLIPFAILLSVLVLIIFHNYFPIKDLIAFAVIYVFGFIVELIGVNTGQIFGHYHYGESLGIKLFNTPLVIGINWLLLVYLSSSVIKKLKINTTLQIIVSSLIMLGYDFIVEQVAPILDMWNWFDNKVPIKNYVAWFILAVFFNINFKIFKVQTQNKLAPVILICHFLFFLVLLISFKL